MALQFGRGSRGADHPGKLLVECLQACTPRDNQRPQVRQGFDGGVAPCVEFATQPDQVVQADAGLECRAHKTQARQRLGVIEAVPARSALCRAEQPAQHIVAHDMDADASLAGEMGDGLGIHDDSTPACPSSWFPTARPN